MCVYIFVSDIKQNSNWRQQRHSSILLQPLFGDVEWTVQSFHQVMAQAQVRNDGSKLQVHIQQFIESDDVDQVVLIDITLVQVGLRRRELKQRHLQQLIRLRIARKVPQRHNRRIHQRCITERPFDDANHQNQLRRMCSHLLVVRNGHNDNSEREQGHKAYENKQHSVYVLGLQIINVGPISSECRIHIMMIQYLVCSQYGFVVLTQILGLELPNYTIVFVFIFVAVTYRNQLIGCKGLIHFKKYI